MGGAVGIEVLEGAAEPAYWAAGVEEDDELKELAAETGCGERRVDD